jgi:hypothetical protein
MNSKLLLAGMPDSGKSTFIAALRHLLVSNDVGTALKLVRLSDSQVHLNKLEKNWIACEKVERTPAAAGTWLTFHVQDTANGREADLMLPDLSGEAYRQPSSIGKCRKSLYDAMAAIDGIALFTNANRGHDDDLIDDLSEIVDLLGDDNAEAPAPAIKDPAPFDPEDMPEEAQLVELLQCMNRRPLLPRRRRIALIVSAWDVAEAEQLAPVEWFTSRRPMLAQFLKFNAQLWDLRVYGVSAQGGDLPRDKDSLQKIRKPSHRIRIVGSEVARHDLSAPLNWLMMA